MMERLSTQTHEMNLAQSVRMIFLFPILRGQHFAEYHTGQSDIYDREPLESIGAAGI
jgi:hypothetical protein